MTRKFENKLAWIIYGFDPDELRWIPVHYDEDRSVVEERLQDSIEHNKFAKKFTSFCTAKEEVITTPVEYFDAKICYVKTPIDITK